MAKFDIEKADKKALVKKLKSLGVKHDPKAEEDELRKLCAENLPKEGEGGEDAEHDEDAKLPLEQRKINHTVCGKCNPGAEPRGEESVAKGEDVEDLDEEVQADLVVTASDTKEPLKTHRRVRLTEEALELNPKLEERGLRVGDVIQVPKGEAKEEVAGKGKK